MRLLVLGGSGFVGRAVVDEGLARGWEVAAFNRGTKAHPDARVVQLTGDRLGNADLRSIADGTWDLVVDTWSGAPEVVLRAARALQPKTDRFVYVSSCSVYPYPPETAVNESVSAIDGDANGGDSGYPTNKRGGELAVETVFGDRALIPRPGLILGPHEDVGRLPWWLIRIDRGGEVLAPGPEDLPLQYVDARDLARWIFSAADRNLSGPYNTVSRSGHGTMRALLEACVATTGSDATLHWVGPARILRAGVEPWSELPIWIPRGHEARGLHEIDGTRAAAAGLTCRPIEETVRDTWSWVVHEDRRPPLRADREPPGLDAAKERAVLGGQP